MLRFTYFNNFKFILKSIFQNILCYGLPRRKGEAQWRTSISKHPMLRFTPVTNLAFFSSDLFQNILCYGLPCSKVPDTFLSALFQNILCYGLPRQFCEFIMPYIISKHPMLRFTLAISQSPGHAVEFQNILCYGLPFRCITVAVNGT